MVGQDDFDLPPPDDLEPVDAVALPVEPADFLAVDDLAEPDEGLLAEDVERLRAGLGASWPGSLSFMASITPPAPSATFPAALPTASLAPAKALPASFLVGSFSFTASMAAPAASAALPATSLALSPGPSRCADLFCAGMFCSSLRNKDERPGTRGIRSLSPFAYCRL